jgi:hypothetical protein
MAADVTYKLWDVSDIVAVIDAWEAERNANGIEYKVEKNRIGEGYFVRKLVRYAEPVVQHGFASPGAAEDWIEADRAAHRPGRKRKAASQ